MLKPLSFVEINPDQSPVATIIWLHGLGADGHDFVPIVPQLQLPTSLPIRFVFPHADMRPVTINGGHTMRAWYDIYSLGLDKKVDQESIFHSAKRIEMLIEAEHQRGMPTERIILAGFSQGAVIALTTGLRFNKTLGGIMVLSGYFPAAEEVLRTAHTANKDTPIFVGHGTQDTVVPYFLGQQIHLILQKNAYRVSWHSYEMPHTVCHPQIADMTKWLTTILN